MPLTNLNKTPFPWFGGKADAAPAIWAALGDPAHYIEPFAGSLAVLLRRPHMANRTYFAETVNDLDGLLTNAWRSIALSPDATAEAASWPVSELDLMARHLALVGRKDDVTGRLRADPAWHDPVLAGWWMWGQSSWIGSGWCSGMGKWAIDATGAVVERPKQAREPGVTSKRPHLSNDGMGVNHAQAREHGVGDPEYHPMTMPELRRWMRYLSARLRHVRICCGDWARVCKSGAAKYLPVRSGGGHAGFFLDPPYAFDVRTADVYAHDSAHLAADVHA